MKVIGYQVINPTHEEFKMYPVQKNPTKGSSSEQLSLENYGIDNSLESINESIINDPIKRQNNLDTFYPCEKRLKLDRIKSPSSQNSNMSSADIFEDTLENLNISDIYKSNTTDSNVRYSNRTSDSLSHQQTIFQDGFSQAFNTQVINHIDTVISIEEENINQKLDMKTNNNKPNQVDNSKQKTLLESLPNQIHNRSLLFSNKKVTLGYKKEVDDIFEQIEHYISTYGTNTGGEHTIPDKILDDFFSSNLNTTLDININGPQFFEKQIHEKLHGSLMASSSRDDSLLNIAESSFGTALKQTLLKNVSKNMQSNREKTLDLSLSHSFSEPPSKFYKLGDFYDLPDKVANLIKQYKGIDKLYDWQNECLNLAIQNRNNLIYTLPTSGGKTLVAEILMLRELLCFQQNAIFILPYIAIVQEKVWDFSPFGVALDFLVEEYASSKGVYPPRKRRRKHSVYIATIEKALGLVNSLIETNRLNEIGLVVIDELHLIGDQGRGAVLETLLTKLMFLNANIQIIGMSATIGNIKDICDFLKAKVYAKDFRPVDLMEYVKCGTEMAKINWNCKNEEDLFTNIKNVDYNYSESFKQLDPDMLCGLALEIIPKDSCLIFCASKKNCENVVNLLCKLARPDLKNHRKVEKDQLLQALKSEAGELCDILKLSVPFGFAYHHSGLTGDERRLLEDAFRSGTICVICCTSTLAAGVNLPARRVIIRSPYVGREFITLSKYKQMAGRAGRAGLGETGESIIIAQTSDMPKVKKLLLSPMNQAISSLHELDGRGLRHLLLSCISLGIANTRSQLQNVSNSTLMAVQIEKLNVNIKKLTDNVIKSLFKLGALEESCSKGKETDLGLNISVKLDTSSVGLSSSPFNTPLTDVASNPTKPKRSVVLTSNTKLVVSNLGCAAIKGGLELSRAHQLYDDLYKAQKSLVLLNCLHLLYLVTPYETSDQVRPNIQIYHEVLTQLDEKEQQTSRILGFDEGVILKMTTGQVPKQIPERVLNRFYVTLILYDLWKESPVFKVSNKFQIHRGIVQNLMTTSATFASNVVNFCDQLEEFWSFSYLLKGLSQRLSHCCVKELLPLMDLPSVKQTRAKQLYNAGYRNLQSIAKSTIDELVQNIEFLSRGVAAQLIAASKMLLLEKVENLREEAEDVLYGDENPLNALDLPNIP
ncbi:helicase POLQ-like [Sitophilus oryzae]|uniref:Helicase POLQ-like n=1 Tax=Sitophilus oryzae TaxID=7048 RepID=A0A6J2YHV7_SITOR|nr:helicase POLQ-like [Sitophilus oryzae]